MSLYGALAAHLDARPVATQTVQELGHREARVALVAAWGHDVGGREVAVDGRNKLRGELGEVAADQRAEFACLVAEAQERLYVRDDVGVGFQEALRWGVHFDPATGQVEEDVAARFVMQRVVPAGGDGAVEVL